MIDFLNSLDAEIFLALNGCHAAFFDSFMKLFSGRFIWIPMYAVALLIFLRGGNRKQTCIYLLALVAAIVLTDQVCATVIRPVVERMRPSNLLNPLSAFTHIVDGYRGGPYGFPSCHGANSFALVVFMALFVRRWKFTLFIVGWGLLNSYSRIYLGVHYPGDLLVGGLIGGLIGWLCYAIATYLCGPDATASRSALLSRPLFPAPSASAPTASSASVPLASSASAPSASSDRAALSWRRLTAPALMMCVFALTLCYIIIASLIR